MTTTTETESAVQTVVRAATEALAPHYAPAVLNDYGACSVAGFRVNPGTEGRARVHYQLPHLSLSDPNRMSTNARWSAQRVQVAVYAAVLRTAGWTVEEKTVTTGAILLASPPMRGLTVRQPWAFAIAEGFKTVENRTRRTNYRGPLLIHAGLKHDRSVPIVRYSRDAAIRLDELGGSGNFWEARGLVPSVFYKPHATLALGAVIATARLDGCHEAVDGCCAPWGVPGCWHWELADVQPLQTAVARTGALTLWKADADLLGAVAEARGR